MNDDELRRVCVVYGLDLGKLMARDSDELDKLMRVLNMDKVGTGERLVYNRVLDGFIKLHIKENE